MSSTLKTVLASRRIGSAASLWQSLIGVAFRSRNTWLLSPADRNACLPIMQGSTSDPWGQPAQVQVFQCHVGAFLDAAFPDEQDFEIFRMHLDAHKLEPWNRQVHGVLLAEYADYMLDGRSLNTNTFSVGYVLMGYALPEVQDG